MTAAEPTPGKQPRKQRSKLSVVPPDGPQDGRHYESPLAKAEAADRPLPYVQALRWLREDTKRSFQQIANTAHGRLPKSTAHYMTTVSSEPERTRLPARAELVELFVRGCGRPEAEVRAWVAHWDRIKREMKLAKEKTVRLRPVPACAPKPPEPPSPNAGPAFQVVPAEPGTGRHRLPDASVWRRFRRWIRFLSRILMIVIGALLIVGKDGLPGMGGEAVGSVLLTAVVGSVIGIVTAAYLMSSPGAGYPRRAVFQRAPLQKALVVLGDRRPTRV